MAINTVDARSKLKARRAPYWHKLASGRHLGYRKMVAGSDGTWLAQAYDEETRKQTRHSLGSFDNLPQNKRFDAASAAARAWFDHLGMGGSTVLLTVRAACEEYTAHVRTERPRAADDAEARFRRWVYGDKIANIELHKLTERQVKVWRTSLTLAPVIINPHAIKPAERTRSPSSINRDMTALRAALNYAQKMRSVTTDLAWRYALVPIKNADRAREAYLDRRQRLALIEQARPDLALLLRAMSLVPIRPGALASMLVGGFDRRLGVLVVGKDKHGRDRKIKLPKDTAEFFALQTEGKTSDALLFLRAGGAAWDKDSWKKPLKPAVKAACLDGAVTLYTLRHSVITDLVTNGLDLLSVAQLSGTSVSMIEKHYGHLQADHAAAALATLTL